MTDKRLKANRTTSAESDQSILSDVIGVLKVFPSFGYRRISGVIAQRCRNQGKSPVNHKRILRIMHQFNLTLPPKLPPQGFSSDYRRHVAVAEPDRR
ncbi:MAG: IS3 family transposase [Mesosutterella multiformis]|nr:IS3 family transposase [Mesosutterella multiformis]